MMPLPLLSDQELERVRSEYPLPKNCPTCHGVGEYLLEGVPQACDCVVQVRLSKAYYSANIGQRWHVLGWDHFVSSDREALVPPLQKYVTEFESNLRYGLGWTISGGFGTGKTLLLCCTLKDLIKQGYSCYFVQGTELKDVFLAASGDAKASATLNQRLRRVQVLGLDDVVAGMSAAQTELISNTLEGVIRYRYNNNLPTLITTNLDMKEEKESFPRVFSLLTAVNDWHTAKGTDYRGEKYRWYIKELQANGEALPVL